MRNIPSCSSAGSLTPAEKNYATVERRLLAINGQSWSSGIILGRKFTLLTDHAPLQWMARAKDTTPEWRGGSCASGFCLRRPPSGRSLQRQRGWTLSDLVSIRRSVRGHSPPNPNLPLAVTLCSTGTRTTLRGGECDERPEHSSALPWRRTRITCTSSSRPDQPHLELVYPRLDKPWETRKEGETYLLWAGELTCGLLLPFQKPACDGSCPAWSTADPPSTGTHGGEHLSTATTSPSPSAQHIVNKSTLRWYLLSSPCRVILPPRYNIYIISDILMIMAYR